MSAPLEALVVDLGEAIMLQQNQREVIAQLMDVCTLAEAHGFAAVVSLDRDARDPEIHLRVDLRLSRAARLRPGGAPSAPAIERPTEPAPEPVTPDIPAFLRPQVAQEAAAAEAAPELVEPEPAPDPHSAEAPQAEAESPAPEPPAPVELVPASPLLILGKDETPTRAEMIAHVRWLHGALPHEPPLRELLRLDLDIVERLFRGFKAHQVAEQLDIPKSSVVARWKRLTHNRPVTLGLQTALLEALRHLWAEVAAGDPV